MRGCDGDSSGIEAMIVMYRFCSTHRTSDSANSASAADDGESAIQTKRACVSALRVIFDSAVMGLLFGTIIIVIPIWVMRR